AQPEAGVLVVESTGHFYIRIDTGSSTTTDLTRRVEVEFAGLTEAGQVWTFDLDGTLFRYRVIDPASVADGEVIDEWVLDGGIRTYTATTNRNPRLSNIAEAIGTLLATDTNFADYSVARFGRILDITG